MKRMIYYQFQNKPQLYTEREVKLRRMDKRRMKRLVLARDEVITDECFGRIYNPFDDCLSAKSLKKANVRRDLMRLGIVW